MSTMSPFRVAAAVLMVTSAVTMSGCATLVEFATIAESVEPGLGPGLPPEPAGREFPSTRVVTLGEGEPIVLVTYGSSSCPDLPITAVVDGEVLTITVRTRPAEVCTADLGPTTSRIPPVDGFDPVVVTTALVTHEGGPAGATPETVTIEQLN